MPKLKTAPKKKAPKGPVAYMIYIQGRSENGNTGAGGWTAEVWKGNTELIGASRGCTSDATNESLYLIALSNALDVLIGRRPTLQYKTKKTPLLFPLDVKLYVFTNLKNVVNGIEGPHAPAENYMLWLSIKMKWSMFMFKRKKIIYVDETRRKPPLWPRGVKPKAFFEKMRARAERETDLLPPDSLWTAAPRPRSQPSPPCPW